MVSVEQIEEVIKRANQTLEYGKNQYSLLSYAFDHLSLGKAYHLLSQTQQFLTSSFEGDKGEAHLEVAVAGLRKAGTQQYLPLGLLARAAWHRQCKAYEAAATDLAEVEEIASAGGMRLHLCDYHLESAWLALAQEQREKAKEHFGIAERMVLEMGYGRREGEVKALREALGGV